MKNTLKVTTPNDFDIVITREFDAPRRLVWDAHTRPELVQKWLLGPPGWTMPICEIDLKVGGKYRYVWHSDKKNKDMEMGGEYREITTHEKIVATEWFKDAWYPGEAIDTTTFVEQGKKTVLTLTMRLATKEARDGIIATGMESGVAISYDRLDEILAAQ